MKKILGLLSGVGVRRLCTPPMVACRASGCTLSPISVRCTRDGRSQPSTLFLVLIPPIPNHEARKCSERCPNIDRNYRATSLTAYTFILHHSRCQAWALWDRETRKRVADLFFVLLRSNGMIKQAYPRILWTCKSSGSAYRPGLTPYRCPNLSTLRHLSDSRKMKWPITIATDPGNA